MKSEAVAWNCSVKKRSYFCLQNSQENTCFGVSCWKSCRFEGHLRTDAWVKWRNEKIYFHISTQCGIKSLFGDTVYSCYGFLILITLDRWKRHFRVKNYIENYFYLLKSTKITSQKCWRNIIWADFFGRPYCTNGIKTRQGSSVPQKNTCDGVLCVFLQGTSSQVLSYKICQVLQNIIFAENCWMTASKF